MVVVRKCSLAFGLVAMCEVQGDTASVGIYMCVCVCV
jgi:hypothetical protein